MLDGLKLFPGKASRHELVRGLLLAPEPLASSWRCSKNSASFLRACPTDAAPSRLRSWQGRTWAWLCATIQMEPLATGPWDLFPGN